MSLPARNDPCPCGSGLKYKKCCMIPNTAHQPASDGLSAGKALAYKQMSEENWLQAIAMFREILESAPDQYDIYEAIAASYDGLEDYMAAAEYYEKAIASSPQSKHADLYYYLGLSRACAQRVEKAIEAFQKCLELQHDLEKKAHLARVLEELEQIRSSKKDPRLIYAGVQLHRAFADMEADRFQAAATRLERLISIDPENSAIFYNLGVVYSFLKRIEDAMANFQRAVEINPDYAEAWYNMGQVLLFKKKDFSQALNCFDRAIAIRPDYIGAHHQRGVACELIGNREKAIACWERTLELDPENSLAKDNVARLRRVAQQNPVPRDN
ncbi:MAG: tetratricopeptide repeat protein [Deltaproteobacteria bacterium]|nr:tetratricopeptide repeat protein [Deltaproteobacteria bacterium]